MSSRHLASPAEVVAALRDVAPDGSGVTSTAREWDEVQVVQLQFRGAGAATIAPIAFQSVSTFTGAASILSVDADGHEAPSRLPRGATLIQRPGVGARYAWTAPHDATMVCLDPAVLRGAAEALGRAHAGRVVVANSFAERDLVCEHLVRALAAEAAVAPHAGQPLLVQSITTALAARLLARAAAVESRVSPRAAPPRGGLDPQALRRVRAYVAAHLGRRITLDDLAATAGTSRFHFARQFRRSTGESPLGTSSARGSSRGRCGSEAVTRPSRASPPSSGSPTRAISPGRSAGWSGCHRRCLPAAPHVASSPPVETRGKHPDDGRV